MEEGKRHFQNNVLFEIEKLIDTKNNAVYTLYINGTIRGAFEAPHFPLKKNQRFIGNLKNGMLTTDYFSLTTKEKRKDISKNIYVLYNNIDIHQKGVFLGNTFKKYDNPHVLTHLGDINNIVIKWKV